MVIVLTTVGGCSHFFKSMFHNPSVKVLAISFDEEPDIRNLGSIPLIISIEVENPNSFSITSKSLVYTLAWREEEIAGGEIRGEKKVPAEGRKTFHIPVRISIEPMMKAVGQALKSHKVTFTAYGSLTLSTFTGDISIPFRKNISKDLKEFVKRGK